MSNNDQSRGRRSFWTWGHEIDEPSEQVRQQAAKVVSDRIGVEVLPPTIPFVDEIELRNSRISVPHALAEVVSTDRTDRITHTYGGHSLELLEAIRGNFPHPPDAVAYPKTDTELEKVLSWCDSEQATMIPYGGGTSVVWGLNVPEDCERAVSIDLDGFNSVLEIDDISRSARIQGGILGPDLEAHLRPIGLTLRHFPQSFPWSTVGGWIATRSGGHYATNHTHIDDFVESLRMLSPRGWFESRRLPGSGAGPSPDRLLIGSEGTLGIITEAWLRLQKRPKFRATAGVLFNSWREGTDAVRAIVQTKLFPANLRILDPVEAHAAAGTNQGQALLIIGFESSELSQAFLMNQAVTVARDHGGVIDDEDILVDDGTGIETGRTGAVGRWRKSFIGVNAGTQLGLGILSDTFETAITWDKWLQFDAYVRSKVQLALDEALGPKNSLSCRFTHVYPDGPAPYYSYSGPVRIGREFEAWQHIKETASHAVIEAGGTITHHHAVGRMHKTAWAMQRPSYYDEVLKSVKSTFDPNHLLNPGVLID